MLAAIVQRHSFANMNSSYTLGLILVSGRMLVTLVPKRLSPIETLKCTQKRILTNPMLVACAQKRLPPINNLKGTQKHIDKLMLANDPLAKTLEPEQSPKSGCLTTNTNKP